MSDFSLDDEQHTTEIHRSFTKGVSHDIGSSGTTVTSLVRNTETFAPNQMHGKLVGQTSEFIERTNALTTVFRNYCCYKYPATTASPDDQRKSCIALFSQELSNSTSEIQLDIRGKRMSLQTFKKSEEHQLSKEHFGDNRSSSLIDKMYKQELNKIAEHGKKTKIDRFAESLKEIRKRDTESDKQMDENLSRRLEQIDVESLARREKIRQMEEEISREQDEFEKEREREEILFREKLEAQNIEHRKKMEKLRMEREQIEREAEEEFEEHLRRLEEQKQAFWRCIQLKLRFEEKEQEWADFLQTLRNTLRRPKTQCSQLKGELERGFGDLEDDDVWIEQEYEKLHVSTMEAYRVFYNVFYYLQKMSEMAEDRVFLKILMKSAAEMSNKLCEVLEKLDTREVIQNQKVDFFKNIDYFDVPSTRKLKELSKKANVEDYRNLEEPLRYGNK